MNWVTRPENPVIRTAIFVGIAATIVLFVLFFAMQFTNEINWGIADFGIAWILLVGAGLTYTLVVKMMNKKSTYNTAVGVAVLTALLLIWMNLGVGIIGSEDNPINLAYVGVLVIGVIGAFLTRLQSHGMERTLIVMALAQVLITLVALIGRLGEPENGWLEIVTLNGFFVALWGASAWLFRQASKDQAPEAAW